MEQILSKIKPSYVFGSFVALAVMILISMNIGVNDNGYRTILQNNITGSTTVQFSEGVYLCPFCNTTVYPDVLTYELPGDGLPVQYQDGGMGIVDGVVRTQLSSSSDMMLKLHKAVRDPAGLRTKLLEPEVQQALNLTAGLMTSEEAYAVRRNDYANWAKAQVQKGVFKTELQKKTITMQDGTEQVKEVPVISLDKNGLPEHQGSPFADYGLRVAGFQVTRWDFEKRTRDQISEKREAEMAIITARANADKAVWQQKEIKANGEKEVERVRYEQLKIKEQALISAAREKEVAVIAAEKIKEVNSEKLEAAKIDVQTAKEQAKAKKTRANAEAYAKKAILEADGALDKKLAAYVKAQEVWANAYASRKVPTMVMGGGAEGVNTDTTQFQSMLNALIAKDLVLDPKVSK